jgi:selenocysteine-specific elongation factor
MTVVVGTCGHIDHGKTTLLRVLTGIDADRLPEERRRGMTIDVGYAHMRLPDGSELDFVDVPGHDRLIGNMLVGAGEIDAALVVVAADDGPRPQTLEHLELLDALGVINGVAVVTKADTVDSGRATAVAEATGALLSRTSLVGAPVTIVSAADGTGLEQLRDALVVLRDRVVAHGLPDGPARLAIDRAFSVKGRGTVVTGTLRGGPLEAGMSLRVVPGDREVRIREIQVHGGTVERAADGGRVALNLAGIGAAQLHRGMVLAASSDPTGTDRVLVALRPVAGLVGEKPPIPSDRARVRVHAGTDQVGAIVGRGGRDNATLPNDEQTAILRFERPVALTAGDRFVVRRPSPATALAGGRILDTDPPRGVSRRRMTPERLAVLAAAGTVQSLAAARLVLHGAIGARQPILADDVAEALRDEAVAMVAAEDGWLPRSVVRDSIARRLRRLVTLPITAAADAAASTIESLVDEGRIAADGDRLAAPGRSRSAADPALLAAMDRLEAVLNAIAPPPLREAALASGCSPDGIRALESAGRIVILDTEIAYSVGAYRRLEALALALAAAGPLAPAAFRDAAGTSRKYVMAILEDLDRRGVLRRTPDGHVPGPRAPLVGSR